MWAELGAAMPGSGGTYLYLREAFQYRTGRLMPFLFVWTAILFIPLIMSTGVYGFVSYLRYLWPTMTTAESYVVGLALIVLIIGLLWRRIDSIGRLASILWVIMICTVLVVIVAAYTHFNAAQVFTFPAHAFDITRSSFWIGFAGGLTIGVYDYLGYNTSAYLGAEIKKQGRTIPRSIVYSVLGMMVIYLAMQVGVLGVVDWHEMLDTTSAAYTSVVSVLLERTLGATAAKVVTVFILVTAFTSVLAGLLAGSRVPYEVFAAMTLARDGGRGDRPDADTSQLAALGQDALDRAARAVANLAIVLDPQVVAVSGGMLRSADQIIPQLSAALAQLVPFPPRMVLAHFTQHAPLAGACLLAYRAARLPAPGQLQIGRL